MKCLGVDTNKVDQGRELGLHGIESYLEIKQVNINLDETPIGWY